MNKVFENLEEISSVEAVAVTSETAYMAISFLEFLEALAKFEVVSILRLNHLDGCQVRYNWSACLDLFSDFIGVLFIESDLFLHFVQF